MSELVDEPEYDEYGPNKKMKVDAAMSSTIETRDEIVDDDEGWDDIYGATSGTRLEEEAVPTATHVPSTAPAAMPIEPPVTQSLGPAISSEERGGAQIPAMNEDQYVDETPHLLAGQSMASQDVLNETSTTGDVRTVAGDMDVSTMPIELAATVVTGVPTEPPPAADTTVVPASQPADESAEFRFDSSDADSDDSSTDSLSSDSDDDSDEDYPLLDPATAAKMLMAGDGDDEDAGDKKGKGGGDNQPRTTNEVKEDVIPRPNINITPEMQITVLGKIEGIVENSILIRGHTSGEYQVLEPGSVLCTHDRKVVGIVADLFGRVQQPMYSVLFNSAQEDLMQELQLVPGTELSYVNDHSKFVFTQPLRTVKGTDASNIHDEEVGEDEMEFSDDEQEAEYKRQRKLAKKAGRGGLSRGAFNEGERLDKRTYGAPNHDSGRPSSSYGNSSDAPMATYGGGMNYDDDSTGDGFYQPLKRPDNLAELMAGTATRPNSDRGRGRGRGRGDRARGRGDRGRGRGGQRGGYNREADRSSHQGGPSQQNTQPNPPSAAVPLTAYSPHQQQQQQQQYAQPTDAYQFNGYTFQYGNASAQVPQPQASYAYYAAPQPGAYVNPALYTNYQQQVQQQQPAYQASTAYPQHLVTAQGGQPYGAPAHQASGDPLFTAAQQQDLAEVMRRLNQYSQPR